MQMQQESRAVRCGNPLPQGRTVCGGGFRLFNLAGLIWPLSMNRLFSPSLFFPFSSFSFFFARSRRCAPGFAPWFMPKSAPFIISLSPFVLRLPKPFLALLNVCMREIGNADKRPCKFNPSVCPPFDSLADKEGSSVSTILPFVPAIPCSTASSLCLVDEFSGDGRKEALYRKSGMFWAMLDILTINMKTLTHQNIYAIFKKKNEIE